VWDAGYFVLLKCLVKKKGDRKSKMKKIEDNFKSKDSIAPWLVIFRKYAGACELSVINEAKELRIKYQNFSCRSMSRIYDHQIIPRVPQVANDKKIKIKIKS